MLDKIFEKYEFIKNNQLNSKSGKNTYFCKKNDPLKTIIGLMLLVLLSNSYVLHNFWSSEPENEIIELTEKGENETEKENTEEGMDENKIHLHSPQFYNNDRNGNLNRASIRRSRKINWKEFFQEITTPPPEVS